VAEPQQHLAERPRGRALHAQRALALVDRDAL